MRYARCVQCSSMVGWVALVSNLVLLLLKAFVGIISGSQALVADAMYSFKDLISAILVIVGLKISSRPLDKEHPFGHGKVEFVLSLTVSVVFLIVTGFLLVHAVQVLFAGDEHTAPHLIALWTALLSVAVNIFMYFYTRCVSIEINSPIVKTLSHHHYADATSSLAVAVGIIGAHLLGMPIIDTLVAVFEMLHLLYLGGDVFWDAYKGLMDRSAPDDTNDRIRAVAADVDGVTKVVGLRTRMVGQDLSVDLHIQVPDSLTVEEADAISDLLGTRIMERIAYVGSVQVSFGSGDSASRFKAPGSRVSVSVDFPVAAPSVPNSGAD